MPTFDSIHVTGSQTIGKDLQVDGNQTIGGNLQVTGNQTVEQSFNVEGNQTISGHLRVDGSESIGNHLGVTGTVTAGESVQAAFRLIADGQALIPPGAATKVNINFYAAKAIDQPGLMLTGTDGNKYILFVDTTGATPVLGLHPA